MHSPDYSTDERRILLDIAEKSIEVGLGTGRPFIPDTAELSGALQLQRATFVSLDMDGNLRGCTGSLQASRPLADDVAHAAFQTAFHDPRFLPVTTDELARIAIEISILSPLQPVEVKSEAALLAMIEPGVDGLVLEDMQRRATFLPKVWENLREPDLFISELKRKGGWPTDYWSSEFRVYRYTTEIFGR